MTRGHHRVIYHLLQHSRQHRKRPSVVRAQYSPFFHVSTWSLDFTTDNGSLYLVEVTVCRTVRSEYFTMVTYFLLLFFEVFCLNIYTIYIYPVN